MYLLAIDIGNTSTTFGLFKGAKLVRMWRCETKNVLLSPSASEGGVSLNKMDSHFRGNDRKEIDGIIISSVVPAVDKKVSGLLRNKFGVTPVFVTHKNAGIKICYSRPKEIGTDRLVNAVAAWKKYRTACIVVDLGTATTLDYVDSKGRYWGGGIAPGIGIANDALYQAAAKLSRTKIAATKRMIPRSTKEAIQAGVYQGYIGLTERLIRQTIKEVGGRPKIIVTGGFARLIAKGTKIFHNVEPSLTLKGLMIIYRGQADR